MIIKASQPLPTRPREPFTPGLAATVSRMSPSNCQECLREFTPSPRKRGEGLRILRIASA
jgi:hypothetical protein